MYLVAVVVVVRLCRSWAVVLSSCGRGLLGMVFGCLGMGDAVFGIVVVPVSVVVSAFRLSGRCVAGLLRLSG